MFRVKFLNYTVLKGKSNASITTNIYISLKTRTEYDLLISRLIVFKLVIPVKDQLCRVLSHVGAPSRRLENRPFP